MGYALCVSAIKRSKILQKKDVTLLAITQLCTNDQNDTHTNKYRPSYRLQQWAKSIPDSQSQKATNWHMPQKSNKISNSLIYVYNTQKSNM